MRAAGSVPYTPTEPIHHRHPQENGPQPSPSPLAQVASDCARLAMAALPPIGLGLAGYAAFGPLGAGAALGVGILHVVNAVGSQEAGTPKFRLHHQIGGLRELVTQGAMSTVYHGVYEVEGIRRERVIKLLPDLDQPALVRGRSPSALGSPTARNNLATAAVAAQLRFPVVTEVDIGAATHSKCGPAYLGVVMSVAKGVRADQAADELLVRPEVLRRAIQLHVVDWLVDQRDRGPANLFVHEDGVEAIDSDLCWRQTDPLEQIKLPRVMDRETAEQVRGLRAEDLEKILADLRVPQANRAKSQERLQQLKRHIDRLEARGDIVPLVEWPVASARLSERDSYPLKLKSDRQAHADWLAEQDSEFLALQGFR